MFSSPCLGSFDCLKAALRGPLKSETLAGRVRTGTVTVFSRTGADICSTTTGAGTGTDLLTSAAVAAAAAAAAAALAVAFAACFAFDGRPVDEDSALMAVGFVLRWLSLSCCWCRCCSKAFAWCCCCSNTRLAAVAENSDLVQELP